MAYELIICEKPSAAQKIAQALADTKPDTIKNKTVSYFELEHKGKKIVIACAAGHLFNLMEAEKNGWKYPVFEMKWEPSFKVSKASEFSKKFYDTLVKLSKAATDFTIATDYDVEGEVIGYNILNFICKQKDGKRMKYSTLTKDELIDSYEHAAKTINWGLANAGVTRHKLDWMYGINLSRALTLAVKTTGSFKILSSGRVQGPALKILYDREREIQAFKPVPYWEIALNTASPKELEALHDEDKFWDEKKASKTYTDIKNEKIVVVQDLKKSLSNQQPPNPFDLTSLQIEAYKVFKYTPSRTLQIAQELYLAGLISYPRTSSQQLPESIGYKKILIQLSKTKNYKESAEFLLKKSTLKPNNGKKTDPAHPAIYPTGEHSNIGDQKLKVYDLIVKRFLATFAEPAVRETSTINLLVKKEPFTAKGTRTKEQGWFSLYKPYVLLEEKEMPVLNKGDKLTIKKLSLDKKETQPPKRYTEASLVKELEKRNLGTKATRASIIENLYQRNYLDEKSINVTELGSKTVEVLEKYSPLILDEKLTRHFEKEMEAIEEHKLKPETVLDEAKKTLIKILEHFKKHEKKIGEELLGATVSTREKATNIGLCPICKKGKLSIRKGKFGLFIACDRYPECKTTFGLPKNALTKPTEKLCETCHYPIVQIIRKSRQPQELCINPNCPSKKVPELKAGTKCPKCGSPLLVRKSFYGSFIGCSNYPKCRYMQKMKKEDKD